MRSISVIFFSSKIVDALVEFQTDPPYNKNLTEVTSTLHRRAG